MRAGQWENRQGVVEAGTLPVVSGVAAGADFSELPLVSVVLGVAGKTIRGCAFEYAARMTILAGGFNMLTGQRECCQGMVKAGTLPTVSGMAGVPDCFCTRSR